MKLLQKSVEFKVFSISWAIRYCNLRLMYTDILE